MSSQPAALWFSHYLQLQGINHQLEQDQDSWAIWIHSEDELEKARGLLAGYVANPEDPRFKPSFEQKAVETGDGAGEAGAELELDKADPASSRAARGRGYGIGPLTLALVVVCAGIGLLSEFGEVRDRLTSLMICPFVVDGLYIKWQTGLLEVWSGEVWRLFTPMLVHFGFIHLLLNMLCLVYLGSMIEDHERTRRLAGLIVVIALVSNLGQYLLSGPNFGGMSGVVYGLLGYAWMKGRFQPGSGYILDLRTVTFMLIWLFICLAGIIPDVANGAHLLGLLTGSAWGLVSAKRNVWGMARA